MCILVGMTGEDLAGPWIWIWINSFEV